MVKPILLVLGLCLHVSAALAATDPQGIWFTEDKGGVVQVQPCGQALCGVIVGLTPSPNGDLPRDFQGAPQCHRVLLRDLRLEEDGRWHGTVTNPEDGRTYSAEVWVAQDGNMRLRGYIGLPLLGSTQVWPPFDAHVQADCRIR
jgi:uncharacterized protein (DUF2147 family)